MFRAELEEEEKKEEKEEEKEEEKKKRRKREDREEEEEKKKNDLWLCFACESMNIIIEKMLIFFVLTYLLLVNLLQSLAKVTSRKKVLQAVHNPAASLQKLG